MELSERQIKQFVRVIMPKLYEMQEAVNMWTEAIVRLLEENVNEEVRDAGKQNRDQVSG